MEEHEKSMMRSMEEHLEHAWRMSEKGAGCEMIPLWLTWGTRAKESARCDSLTAPNT